MLPIGVQLYSLRELAQKDFVAVLKKVADIGYKLVEPAGFWDIKPTEFKKILDDLGLGIVSSHSPWAHGKGNLGESMEIASILGLDKIVCGYGPNDFADMDSIKRTADNTNMMQGILAKNGFTLFQHNHDFEFQRIDGKLKYEIYRELCPNVKYEIDCFWSTNLGVEDPVKMLDLFAKDTILLHMKDGVASQKVGGDNMVNGILERHVELMPLGTGTLPIKDLIAHAPAQTQAVIVELDYCNTEMVSAITQSYKYMTENGLAAGNK